MMATMSFYTHLYLLSLLACIATSSTTSDHHRPYIVHMDKSAIPSPFTTHESWYTSTLSSLSAPDGVSPKLLYAYNHVIHGFSAVLSPSQLEALERTPGYLASYPESYGKLLTTHTPRFLGLNNHAGLWPASNFGNDTIIGIIDSGVWPESESFNDHGMPPVPERWKGKCEEGTDFNSSHCNRKLVGARYFNKGLKERGINISITDDFDSPRDFNGHGTHTSSTAAGNRVHHANYFGYAEGTAVGIAPMARVAMYKVWWATDTYDSAATDVLAGMDQAIEDGVDLISLSLAFIETPFYDNPIALGAFAALEKGIFVNCAGGNAGPHAYTIQNGAPWITTVGAGTIDRGLAGSVTLGSGTASFLGKSMYPETVYISHTPLYYGKGNRSKEICDDYSLDQEEVAGKVVFCDFDENGGDPLGEVNRTSAVGAIYVSDSPELLKKDDFSLPVIAISLKNGERIKQYIKNTTEPTVDMEFQITVLDQKPAPQVAWFSSRGPTRYSPGILKPDILAPGVDILAAWVPNRGAVPVGSEYLVTDYYLASGTSMASPHVVGIAALLRAVHPDWSPAAIRSSLMTTADIIDNSLGPIIDQTTASSGTPLDFGGGHVNPGKAMDPGLVYDIEVQDYIDFLCGLNYTRKQIAVITRRSNYSCITANLDLNYPSFMVIFDAKNMMASRFFRRVLTNVADSLSVYRVVVKAPTGMRVVVEPETLSFSGKYSKQGFTVSVEISLEGRPGSDYIGNYGYITWVEDGSKHEVRSPIVSAREY